VAVLAGVVNEFSIDLWWTSTVFLRGHSLRVQVTSGNFPRWDSNLNTGESVRTGTEMLAGSPKHLPRRDPAISHPPAGRATSP
jgi:predicted acyl esterase